MSRPQLTSKHYSDSDVGPKAPTMSRSRGQLAGSYAPGAFFTFEGGLGACLSIPDSKSNEHQVHLLPSIEKQVMARMDEAAQNWFKRAYLCRDGDTRHPIDARLCIENGLLNHEQTGIPVLNRSRFLFVNPTVMGYTPAPLTFTCNRCKLFRYFSDAKDLQKNKWKLTNSCRRSQGKPCQWRQLDIIFVHWSGNWQPVMPGKYNWSNEQSRITEPYNRCQQCQSEDLLLHSDSPNIGKWFFQCANESCGHIDKYGWVKNDVDTLRVLQGQTGERISEAHMEPISYRASQAFYALSEQFVIFSQTQDSLLAVLDANKAALLSEFIAGQYHFEGHRPTLEEMKFRLETSNHAQEWEKLLARSSALENARLMATFVANHPAGSTPRVTADKLIADAEAARDSHIESWFSGENPLIAPGVELPSAIATMLADRQSYPSRYDPVRLMVEHEALSRSKLKAPTSDYGRRPFVNFAYPDQDLSPKDEIGRRIQQAETAKYLGKLGFKTMGLIREFDLCRFTYGYSRMHAVPFFAKRDKNMPVKLNLFPSVQSEGGPRHPVYVVTQANEALYIQLDEVAVYNWLRAVGPTDMFDWSVEDKQPLGARLLERGRPFGRFLEGVRANSASSAYTYVYTLLHTFSHVIMKAVAEFSGLDLGSLSEYLFPTDLALVVYRNGTTMDLGNLSALWRTDWLGAFIK